LANTFGPALFPAVHGAGASSFAAAVNCAGGTIRQSVAVGDVNHSGIVNVHDIFDFPVVYFAGFRKVA
jgi:hypothetical protein